MLVFLLLFSREGGGGGQQLFLPAMDFGVKPALLSSFLRPEAPLCSFLWGGAVLGAFWGGFWGSPSAVAAPLARSAAQWGGWDGMGGGGPKKCLKNPKI